MTRVWILPSITRPDSLIGETVIDTVARQLIQADGHRIDFSEVKPCRHHHYPHGHEKAAQSWHLPEFCTAHGALNLMTQWAVLLGYEEINVVGCDPLTEKMIRRSSPVNITFLKGI